MRTIPLFAGAALFALAATDCTSFPSIDRGTCGNAVIDPGEDCDGFARGAGTTCGAPGSSAACRLGCSFDPDGAVCPSGWGCGADGICREPSGKFVRKHEAIVAGAWRVALADFDGDHRKDVLTRAQVDARGFSKLRAHYFDADMALSATGFLPTKVGSPVARDLDGDGRSDLVFTVGSVDGSLSGATTGALGVMLGQKDRSFSPVAYPTFVFADTDALMFPIRGFPGYPMRVLVFGSGPTGAALLHPDVATGGMGYMTMVPDGPTALAGSAVGNLIETTPCDELVWAYAGKASASVMTACKRDIAGWTWNDGGAPIDIALPAGVTVDAGVRIADVNLDGHRDVLIGASGKTYVAYGNGAGGFSALDQPFTVPVYAAVGAMPLPSPVSLPLAIGDVSGDGKPDYVLAQRVLTSIKGDPNGGYTVAFRKSPGAWTSAAIVDLDVNGLPDVIAGSSADLDLDFLNGTGTAALNPFTIPTAGTTSQFAVGDVDGDLLPDLVFAESSPGAEDQLAIVFGKVGAIPDVPISVGRFGRIAQAVTFNPGAAIDSIGVISHSADVNDKSARIALLAGSGDRLPLAPFALTTQTLTGVPFNVVTGSFAKDANVDVVALAGDLPPSASAPFASFRMWLAPATAPARFQISAPSDPLAAALHPVSGAGISQRAAAHTASGDIDRDGVTDVVAVMPFTKDDATSALVVMKPKSDGKGGYVMGVAAQVELPFPIAVDGDLALVDVDGDGALDVVVLGGAAAARQLVVLWNDGAGGFAASRATSVSAEGDQATDFGVVRASATSVPAIAYVTRTSLVVATISADHKVTRDTIDATLNYGTGVAGGDVDGDGVDDLAVADTPSLVLYRGQPVLK